MNKLYLSSALLAIFALPAFADINKNAQSATCDSSTIGATSGSAYMDTAWTANTINLDFYSDGEKISTGSCTYDGAIELPNDPEDKTGYTFGGWKVRVAAAPTPALPNCSTITDIAICSNTEGCAGPSDMSWDNGGPYYNRHYFTTGCFRPIWADTVSYNSCSEITDTDICTGLVAYNDENGGLFRLCELDKNGHCATIDTWLRQIYHEFPISHITEALCSDIQFSTDWDSDSSKCYVDGS